MRRPPDPEIAASLARRAIIFEIVRQLKADGADISSDAIVRAMRAESADTFKPTDYLWVETTLAKRIVEEPR